MKKSNHHPDVLISKFLSGNLSPEEKIEFEAWLNASSDNKRTFQQSKKAWEISKNKLSPEDFERDKTKVLNTAQKQQSTQILRIRRQLILFKVAAILAIPVTFALSWYFMNKSGQLASDNLVTKVTAPKGHVAKCFLPDGTEVWVNTGSTLSYDTDLFNKKKREIHLSGEAYFEVVKNKTKPFCVKTPLANIKVTGTSFNVKAYPEEEIFEAVLAEGSIEMVLNNSSEQKINLVPGERAVFKKNVKGILIEKIEADFFTSWRNGEILFKDATLNDLVKELERIYDIQFYLKDPNLGEFRFRGMFSYNNNLIEALEKIKRTANIDYYIEHKEVWLYRN
ncbi:DUF4974 domain-containing protein [Maribellus comscasis]|uniref:DUF4974 domain-containing protein n=1 Tax=Maribellus comscasis TaxID=2681766 RepID=A0A6I6JKW0_9BACT|nr:FecR domain-containing protein [Maribellus comscasis]QGY43485.1 DUF4974 domain-containing protein [Maribellus comscasis]